MGKSPFFSLIGDRERTLSGDINNISRNSVNILCLWNFELQTRKHYEYCLQASHHHHSPGQSSRGTSDSPTEKLSNTEPQTAVLQKNKTFSLQVFCACGSPEIRVNFLSTASPRKMSTLGVTSSNL